MLLYLAIFTMISLMNAKPQRQLLIENKEESCREPHDLNEQLLKWHQDSSKLDVEPSKFVDNVDEVTFQGNPDDKNICKRPPSTDPASTVMERSLCPWSYRSSYDEQREPKTLTEAFCQCRKSRGNSGSYCMPIRRQVPILKRTHCDPSTKTFVYEKSVHWVTVGCHSVLPRSQRALPVRKHIKINDDYVEV